MGLREYYIAETFDDANYYYKVIGFIVDGYPCSIKFYKPSNKAIEISLSGCSPLRLAATFFAWLAMQDWKYLTSEQVIAGLEQNGFTKRP